MPNDVEENEKNEFEKEFLKDFVPVLKKFNVVSVTKFQIENSCSENFSLKDYLEKYL